MSNISLISLNILSFFSLSPLRTISSNSYLKFTSIVNSHFSRIYPNIIYSNTQFHFTEINNNKFSHTLNTPLKFTNSNIYWEGFCNSIEARCCVGSNYDFQKDSTIEDLNITYESFIKGRNNHIIC